MFKNVKKKTVVIMMAIILPVAAAALVCTFLVVKKDEEEKPVLPPEYYFAKADELSSVTDIVGERSFEDLSPREKLPVPRMGQEKHRYRNPQRKEIRKQRRQKNPETRIKRVFLWKSTDILPVRIHPQM